MPRNDDRIRTPSFRAKMSALKGLAPEEKALLQRIGNLVDTIQFSQRQESNPGRGRKSRIRSVGVPTVQNVVLTSISGGLQINWDPANFSELGFYEVQYDDSALFKDPSIFEVIDTKATLKSATLTSIFVRVRIVSKRDHVGSWSATVSAGVGTGVTFDADGDFIDPENRTTVLPKPTLITKALTPPSGAIVGLGAHIGPGPVTMVDQQRGFSTKVFQRNEITYDLFEADLPYPSLEQRATQNLGEYIDNSSFYNYPGAFYMRFTTLTNSFTDFFQLPTLEFSPTILEVEFLRYRIANTFYNPEFAQTGIVLNASLGVTTY